MERPGHIRWRYDHDKLFLGGFAHGRGGVARVVPASFPPLLPSGFDGTGVVAIVDRSQKILLLTLRRCVYKFWFRRRHLDFFLLFLFGLIPVDFFLFPFALGKLFQLALRKLWCFRRRSTFFFISGQRRDLDKRSVRDTSKLRRRIKRYDSTCNISPDPILQTSTRDIANAMTAGRIPCCVMQHKKWTYLFVSVSGVGHRSTAFRICCRTALPIVLAGSSTSHFSVCVWTMPLQLSRSNP